MKNNWIKENSENIMRIVRDRVNKSGLVKAVVMVDDFPRVIPTKNVSNVTINGWYFYTIRELNGADLVDMKYSDLVDFLRKSGLEFSMCINPDNMNIINELLSKHSASHRIKGILTTNDDVIIIPADKNDNNWDFNVQNVFSDGNIICDVSDPSFVGVKLSDALCKYRDEYKSVHGYSPFKSIQVFNYIPFNEEEKQMIDKIGIENVVRDEIHEQIENRTVNMTGDERQTNYREKTEKLARILNNIDTPDKCIKNFSDGDEIPDYMSNDDVFNIPEITNQIDNCDNAIFEMIKAITIPIDCKPGFVPELDWSMELISDVRESMRNALKSHNLHIIYPGIAGEVVDDKGTMKRTFCLFDDVDECDED